MATNPEKDSNNQFRDIVTDYLEKAQTNRLTTNYSEYELEVGFGKRKPITRTDYENVIGQLIRSGWECINMDGVEMLRISSEYFREQKEKPVVQPPMVDQTIPDDMKQTELDVPKPDDIVEGGAYQNKPTKQQRMVMSTNLRLEIKGSDLIQEYCRYDSIDTLQKLDRGNDRRLKFTEKRQVMRSDETKRPLHKAEFTDHGFHVAYKQEIDHRIDATNNMIRRTVQNWSTTKKMFRCMNRVRFTHPEIPLFVDLSVIKTNRKVTNNGKPYYMAAYTFKSANIVENDPHYEIEIEMNNEHFEAFAKEYTTSKMMTVIRKAIRTVLSGLQETPYPVSFTEQDSIVQEYMTLLHGDANNAPHKKNTRFTPHSGHFIGPQSVTLQKSHLNPETQHNIHMGYMVTEKADGQRALLYISNIGKIYMIKSSMKVVFTGMKTDEKQCFNSLLDGEFILSGKQNQMLFLYAAFDIYYIGSRKHPDVRPFAFSPISDNSDNENALIEGTGAFGADGMDININGNNDKTKTTVQEFRLPLLQKFVSILQPKTVIASGESKCLFRITVKQFIHKPLVYDACKILLDQSHLYDYETDGLIFTPMNTGVGADSPNRTTEPKKKTWTISYKWKPPEQNTIDFYVVTAKDKEKDKIQYIIHDREGLTSTAVAYKILYLHVTSSKDAQIVKDAFARVLEDNIEYNKGNAEDPNDFEPLEGKQKSKHETIPILFKPTTPYDPNAYICYIPLDQQMRMKTVPLEQNAVPEVFDDYTIVEFRYAKDEDNKEGPWKWIPIRVRHDKTEILRSNTSQRSYGNAFDTANNNWLSIHDPITKNAINGDMPINHSSLTEDTIYYNIREKNTKTTEGLRAFHNLYVKSRLISGVTQHLKETVEEVSLIDYSVGKAGDLPKWKDSDIRFVLGIDISKDNVITSENSACKRYLDQRKKHKRMKLRAVFMPGNSAQNIRTQRTAIPDTFHKQVIRSIFGDGNPMPGQSNYVFRHGIAKEGFHISSCQYSLHYFFETHQKLHGFLRNLQECTRIHGYFIGTCYDGQKVFDVLKKTGFYRIERNGKLACQIKKKYQTIYKFPHDENCIGMAIDVYQDSIGYEFKEYLVSFEYLTRLLENYGFVPVPVPELTAMNLKYDSPSFQTLFRAMQNEMTQDKSNKAAIYKKAIEMSKEEQAISFLNRYCIFKKIRDIPQSTLDHMAKETEHMSVQSHEIPVQDLGTEREPPKTKYRKVSKKKVLLEEDTLLIQEEKETNTNKEVQPSP